MPFTATWDSTYEAIPADSEDINLGANRARNLKVAIRERLAIDHSWLGDANDGKHDHATLMAQSGAPALSGTDGAIFTQQIAGTTELFWKDSNGNVVQITSNGTYNTGTVSGPLAVNGTLTVNGAAAVTGALTVGGDSTVTGEIVGGSGSFEGSVLFETDTTSNFYAAVDGSSQPFFAFGLNTSLLFDTTHNHLSFTYNGTLNWVSPKHGTTGQRPASPVVQGQKYWDTTLGIPIWWNGAVWVDATGTPV